MKSISLRVTAFLLVVLLGAFGLVVAERSTRRLDQNRHIVATFYPVYILARNLTDGVEGVTVDNLVPATTGCLHDYQLSPQDLVSLQNADALIICGAGAEQFLAPVQERYPHLPLIDSSEGIALLPEAACVHGQEPGEAEEHDAHQEQDPEGHWNSHIWMSPLRYRQQIDNVCAGLCAYDPLHKEAYRANAVRYQAQVDAVWNRLQAAVARLPDFVTTVLFHDSLTYLADDLQLPVLSVLSVGEEEGITAASLSEAGDRIRSVGTVLFLYDAQYRELTYSYLQKEAKLSASLFLDTAVNGIDSPDAWCVAMTKTAVALEEVSL